MKNLKFSVGGNVLLGTFADRLLALPALMAPGTGQRARVVVEYFFTKSVEYERIDTIKSSD